MTESETMRRHEALLLAHDTDTGRIVRITDQPPDYWIARAYGGTRQIICLLCAHGYDISEPQTVPLIHKGRIGGRMRRHWAHPAGTGPEGGHSPESVWHLHAKLLAAEWARGLPNVTDARMEIPTADRARRSDVLVALADGARLALEPHCYARADGEWKQWLADHRTAGIVPVLLLHPDLPPAHVLWAEGHVQVWQLHLTIAEAGDSGLLAAFLGAGHARSGPCSQPSPRRKAVGPSGRTPHHREGAAGKWAGRPAVSFRSSSALVVRRVHRLGPHVGPVQSAAPDSALWRRGRVSFPRGRRRP